jgi:hypothetical protein
LQGVGYLVHSFTMIVAPPLAGRLFVIVMIPVLAGELSLAGWLLFRADASRWTVVGTPPARSDSTDHRTRDHEDAT